MQKPKKRILNKKVQKAYYDDHVFDEYFLSKYQQYVDRNEIHEILHGSRKTYEDWNMIALTIINHESVHAGRISQRELFRAKMMSGIIPPDEIIREFDLDEYINN